MKNAPKTPRMGSPASINRARMVMGSMKLVSNITETRHVVFSVVRPLGGFVIVIELTVTVGAGDGRVVGSLVTGEDVGPDVVGVLVDGDCVGTPDGADVVGSVDGRRLGLLDGEPDGAAVGIAEVGDLDGAAVGVLDGARVGVLDGAGVGEEVGAMTTAKKCVLADVLEEYIGADSGATKETSLSCKAPPICGSPKRRMMASIGIVKLTVPYPEAIGMLYDHAA